MRLSNLRWLAVVAASALLANPTDPTIITGDVSFDDDMMGTLTVTSESDRSIVDWDAFSIGSSETTVFTLPNSTSAILNRVTGENLSLIEGVIDSNGHVFLVNSNGILIEDGAVISTGAFLASTMDVDNMEFEAGSDMTFTGSEDAQISLRHEGSITATNGDAILLGYQVSTSAGGQITASSGTAALGAGVEILLQPAADQRILVVANTPMMQMGQGIDHAGSISAIRAEIKADGNFYQFAINVDGEVETFDPIQSNAMVRISSEDGTVNTGTTAVISSQGHNGSVGGEIAILGYDIDVDGVIDVSSSTGSGAIYIGGEDGNSHPDFFTADSVTFTSSTPSDGITAFASSSGDGSAVTLKASDTVDLSGTISLNGGAMGGNGGILKVISGNALSGSGEINAIGGKGSGSGTSHGNGGDITMESDGSLSFSGVVNIDGGAGGGDGGVLSFWAGSSHASSATINANGGSGGGSGGKISLLSDGSNLSAGTIDAKGGSISGDGGTVLVCGDTSCSAGPSVDVSAPVGDPGTSSVCPMGGCP